ncbi:MAG: hypothetical protein K0S07_1439 [Chlamydiales bacterium]|jgi:hypothetical protein|nr:hypothetical protein [Chlamydiales bacterium]
MVDRLNVFSQFKVGAEHIQQAFAKKAPKQKRISLFAKGLLECIPVLGLVRVALENRALNRPERLLSPEGLAKREASLKKALNSSSHKLQRLYFQTFSRVARLNSSAVEARIHKVLDYSMPDRSFLSLHQQLSAFYEKQSPVDQKLLNPSFQKLEQAKPLFLKLGLLIDSVGSSKEAIAASLAKDLQGAIFGMKEGESRLLPGGHFQGDRSDPRAMGHAVAMDVKLEDGEYLFRIFNTGMGIENHEQTDWKSGQRYAPLHLKFSPDKLTPQFFEELVSFANIPLHSRNLEQTRHVNRFYEFLKAKGQPERNSGRGYKQQGMVNNCSHKCLMVWLHDSLNQEGSPENEKAGHELYRNFKTEMVENSIADAKPLLEKKRMRYKHPLRQFGIGEGHLLRKVITRSLQFLLGQDLHFHLSRKEMATLIESASLSLEGMRGEKEADVLLRVGGLPALPPLMLRHLKRKILLEGEAEREEVLEPLSLAEEREIALLLKEPIAKLYQIYFPDARNQPKPDPLKIAFSEDEVAKLLSLDIFKKDPF